MRLSRYPINTLKETPAEADIVSHQLMLRAGLVRRLGTGLYTWMPMGLRTLHKVAAIIREEMDRAGALEMFMPAIQPAELWRESGRWEKIGPDLLRLKDRHQREYCVAPTHEEVITDIARRDLKSYRQLPVIFYQIQTKFRDEIRPRFGVMRAREFIMKDAYSFHIDEASLLESYRLMFDTYNRIFERMGLTFRSVQADSGAIGGSTSHEFQVLADSGEDAIAFSDADDYAANLEKAVALPPSQPRAPASQSLSRIATPGVHSIAELAHFLKVAPTQLLKTLLVEGADNTPDERFSPGERYGRTYQINYLRCILCGLCVEACPTRALTMTNEYELADDSRESLIWTKEQLVVPLQPDMEAPPHPMRLGETEGDYYRLGAMLAAANQSDASQASADPDRADPDRADPAREPGASQ